MEKLFLFTSIILVVFSSCIGDDFIDDEIDPVLQITTKLDTLALNESFTFAARYLDNIGLEQTVPLHWSSSAPDVISISDEGLATALKMGRSIISVEYDSGSETLRDEQEVVVGASTVIIPTVRSGTVESTSSYLLTGDFTLEEMQSSLILTLGDNYEATTALPGLYVYLSNNRNSIANAFEIGEVMVFSGTHSYEIEGVDINEFSYVLYFCKPFNVKVGDGEIN